MPTLDGVNDDLRKRIEKVIAEGEGKMQIDSAFRSRAEQQRLYDLHMQDPKKYPPANLPGTSKHECGLAVDVGCAPEHNHIRKDLFKKWGLAAPYQSTEPWHAELDARRLPLPPEPPQPTFPTTTQDEDDDMCARTIVFNDGSKIIVHEDGTTGHFKDAPYFGNMKSLPAAKKQNFKRAVCGTANDPANSHKGYTIWNENGDPYNFGPES